MRYFAYGSNLDLDDLDRWCVERGRNAGGFRADFAAWLPDYEPVFHYHSEARGGGALSVRRRRGFATPGALYEIDEDARALLDQKEGYPSRYDRVAVEVLDARGGAHHAVTYVVTEEYRHETHVRPTAPYLSLVRRGLARFGHPPTTLDAAALDLETPASPSSVFVYGTLRSNEERAAWIAAHDPIAITPGFAIGVLLDLGEYPGIVGLGEGTTRVVGELARFHDPGALLEELDDVEEFLGYFADDSLYHRVLAPVVRSDGATIFAWIYRYARSGEGRVIPSGDWCAREMGNLR